MQKKTTIHFFISFWELLNSVCDSQYLLTFKASHLSPQLISYHKARTFHWEYKSFSHFSVFYSISMPFFMQSSQIWIEIRDLFKSNNLFSTSLSSEFHWEAWTLTFKMQTLSIRQIKWNWLWIWFSFYLARSLSCKHCANPLLVAFLVAILAVADFVVSCHVLKTIVMLRNTSTVN